MHGSTGKKLQGLRRIAPTHFEKRRIMSRGNQPRLGVIQHAACASWPIIFLWISDGVPLRKLRNKAFGAETWPVIPFPISRTTADIG